jgi:hypothetical protein
MTIKDIADVIGSTIININDTNVHKGVRSLDAENLSTLQTALQILQNKKIAEDEEKTFTENSQRVYQICSLFQEPKEPKLYDFSFSLDPNVEPLIAQVLEVKKELQQNALNELSSELKSTKFITALLTRLDEGALKDYIKIDLNSRLICNKLQISEIFNSDSLNRADFQRKLERHEAAIQDKIDLLLIKFNPNNLLAEKKEKLPQEKPESPYQTLSQLLSKKDEKPEEPSETTRERFQTVNLQKEFYREALKKINSTKTMPKEDDRLLAVQKLVDDIQLFAANKKDPEFSKNIKQIESLIFLYQQRQNKLSDLKELLTKQTKPILEEYRTLSSLLESQKTPQSSAPNAQLMTLKQEISRVISCWEGLAIELKGMTSEDDRTSFKKAFKAETQFFTSLECIKSDCVNDIKLFGSFLKLPKLYPLKESFWVRKGLPTKLNEILNKWKERSSTLEKNPMNSTLLPATKTAEWPPRK